MGFLIELAKVAVKVAVIYGVVKTVDYVAAKKKAELYKQSGY
jgi:hypothetical protein